MSDPQPNDDLPRYSLRELLRVLALVCALFGLVFHRADSPESLALMAYLPLLLAFVLILVDSVASTRRWMLIAGIASAIAVSYAIGERGLWTFRPLLTPPKAPSELTVFVTSPVGCSAIAIGIVIFVSCFAGAIELAIRNFLGLFVVMYLAFWFIVLCSAASRMHISSMLE